jgi:hypothetical protein
MRPKMNTVYRRMQKAFKQYVELRDCGMLSSIPELNLDVFNQMDDFLGVPNEASRNLLEDLVNFNQTLDVDTTPQEYIKDE